MIFPAWVNRLPTDNRPCPASVIERDRKKAPQATQKRDRQLLLIEVPFDYNQINNFDLLSG